MKIKNYLFICAAFLLFTSAGSYAEEQESIGVVTPDVLKVGMFKKKPQADVIGDTRALSKVDKMSVPFFKIQFIKSKSGSASESAGGYGGTAKASAAVAIDALLEGVDESVFERITNTAYEDLISKLESAGYSVVGTSELDSSATYQGLKTDAFPSVKKKISTYTAQGLRANGNSFTRDRTVSKLSDELNAPVASVDYTVDFAAFGRQTKGGVMGNTTKASAEMTIGQVAHVWGEISGTAVQTCKVGYCPAPIFRASLGQAAYSGVEMGTFADTTSTGKSVAVGAANLFSGLMGGGSIAGSEKTLTADPQKYEEAAIEALKIANDRIVSKMKAASKS